MNTYAEALHLVTMLLVVLAVPPLMVHLVPKKKEEHNEAQPFTKNATGRFPFFDVVKGIAILAVVVIHMTDLWPGDSSISAASLNTIDATMRFALPVFFIASGILLTPPRYTLSGLGAFYGKRIGGLAVPYVLVGMVLAWLYALPLSVFWHGLYTGQLSVPYYFLLILFQLYLLYPWICRLAQKRWFVYISLFFSIGMQLSPYWYLHDIPLAFRFLFFFVWGIHMRDQILQGSISRRVWPWATLFTLFWVVYLYFPGPFYNMRPFYGVAVFMLLYLTYQKNYVPQRVMHSVGAIGRMSLWIFLVHYPLMAYGIPAVVRALPQYTGWVSFGLLTVLSMLCSTALAALCAWAYGHAATGVVHVLRTAGAHKR